MFFFWVPTDKNPADRPSRVHAKGKDSLFKLRQPKPQSDVVLSSPVGWGQRELFLLHLCSGRRRPHDFAENVERLAADHGLVVVVVCFDPVVNSSHDLEDMFQFRRLQDECDRHFYVGILACPPCCTWSKALFFPIPNGPRPLRSRADPLVPLPNLRPDELQDHALGTILAVRALDIVARVGGGGGWAMLEHPADGGKPYPSLFASNA